VGELLINESYLEKTVIDWDLLMMDDELRDFGEMQGR